MNHIVSIDGCVYHVDGRTAALLERIVRRAEKIERIRIGEIHVKFHNDRVRSLLITESDDPSP
jgi:tRNA A37 methylthiotransferase MiaB